MARVSRNAQGLRFVDFTNLAGFDEDRFLVSDGDQTRGRAPGFLYVAGFGVVDGHRTCTTGLAPVGGEGCGFHEGGRRGIGVRCFSPDEARLETLHEALVADGLVRPPDLTVE